MQGAYETLEDFRVFLPPSTTYTRRYIKHNMAAIPPSQVDKNGHINEGPLRLQRVPNVTQQISNGKLNQIHIFYMHSL